jgi:uncharacterized membrane protein YeiB
MQIARAEDRGDTKATLFKRRLFWLLVIGLMHGLLLWAGDILSVYAWMGFVLLLFRKKSDESLLKWAFGLMIFPVVWYALLLILFLAFAPPDINQTIEAAMIEGWTANVQTVSQGTYWEIISSYNLNYFIGRYIGLVMQMRLPRSWRCSCLAFMRIDAAFFTTSRPIGHCFRRCSFMAWCSALSAISCWPRRPGTRHNSHRQSQVLLA